MISNLELTTPLDETTAPKEERNVDELRLILDVYKHHWDAFLKGYGLYLIACSVLVGYGLSQQADAYNKIFSGIAVIVASIFMFFGMNIAISWMQDTANRAESVARKMGITTISFAQALKAVRTLRMSTLAMIITGVLYIAYVIFIKH